MAGFPERVSAGREAVLSLVVVLKTRHDKDKPFQLRDLLQELIFHREWRHAE